MASKNLRLYVWDKVLWDYGPGIAFALAHDADEARRLIKAKEPNIRDDELQVKPQVITTPKAFAKYGSS